jgi:hypothetical protein
MKKFVSNLGRFFFLLVFVANGAIASDAVSAEKPDQVHPESKIMKLAKLVQKLEAADPWLVEDVSSVLGGIALTLTYSTQNVLSYTTNNFIHEDNLFIEKVELRRSIKKNRMSRLILYFNKDATCFARVNLEKIYPDLRRGRYERSGVIYYDIERAWGRISFGIKTDRIDCLDQIIFIPEGM